MSKKFEYSFLDKTLGYKITGTLSKICDELWNKCQNGQLSYYIGPKTLESLLASENFYSGPYFYLEKVPKRNKIS